MESSQDRVKPCMLPCGCKLWVLSMWRWRVGISWCPRWFGPSESLSDMLVAACSRACLVLCTQLFSSFSICLIFYFLTSNNTQRQSRHLQHHESATVDNWCIQQPCTLLLILTWCSGKCKFECRDESKMHFPLLHITNDLFQKPGGFEGFAQQSHANKEGREKTLIKEWYKGVLIPGDGLRDRNGTGWMLSSSGRNSTGLPPQLWDISFIRDVGPLFQW